MKPTPDPVQIRDALRTMLREQIAPLFLDTPLATQRATLDAMGAEAEMPPGVTVEPTTFAGSTAEWLTPTDAVDRAVLYLHGGGFAMGSCASHRSLAARVAVACRARALLPEYRLAPEHPLPAGLDDALAAYVGLLDAGHPAERLIVAGDSAGGGLTISLAVALAARGLPMPAALVVMSPWVDLTQTGASLETRAESDPWLARAMMKPIIDAYLGGADPADPRASPLFADLRGLPPTLIQVGDQEILLDDARRLAERARAAGVEVEIEVAEHLWHVYQLFAPALPDANDALARIGAFIEARLAPSAA